MITLQFLGTLENLDSSANCSACGSAYSPALAKIAVVSAPPSMPGWSCSRCTYDNVASVFACVACQTPRLPLAPNTTTPQNNASSPIPIPSRLQESEFKFSPHQSQPSSLQSHLSPSQSLSQPQLIQSVAPGTVSSAGLLPHQADAASSNQVDVMRARAQQLIGDDKFSVIQIYSFIFSCKESHKCSSRS